MSAKKLVPDNIVVDLLKEAMQKSTGKKFILDGFPKTTEQAKLWESTVGPAEFGLFLEASDSVLTDRLVERAKMGGKLDVKKEEAFEQVNAWKKLTLPVVQFCEEKGKVIFFCTLVSSVFFNLLHSFRV